MRQAIKWCSNKSSRAVDALFLARASKATTDGQKWSNARTILFWKILIIRRSLGTIFRTGVIKRIQTEIVFSWTLDNWMSRELIINRVFKIIKWSIPQLILYRLSDRTKDSPSNMAHTCTTSTESSSKSNPKKATIYRSRISIEKLNRTFNFMRKSSKSSRKLFRSRLGRRVHFVSYRKRTALGAIKDRGHFSRCLIITRDNRLGNDPTISKEAWFSSSEYRAGSHQKDWMTLDFRKSS